MSWDKLKNTKPKLNIEKSIKQILSILKRPHKVYGHGVVSYKEMEKLIKRVEIANWSVYQLELNDKSIYTGICKGDLDKRMNEHQDGKGSEYVMSRLPFELKWFKSNLTASQAMKEEYRIKQMSQEDKKKLWE